MTLPQTHSWASSVPISGVTIMVVLFKAIRAAGSLLTTTGSCNLTATSIRQGHSPKPLQLTATHNHSSWPDLAPPRHHWSTRAMVFAKHQ